MLSLLMYEAQMLDSIAEIEKQDNGCDRMRYAPLVF